MKKSIIAAAALAALASGIAAPQTAQAQAAATCQGRVVIDTIYQTGLGGNNYEYFIHLRNATRTALTVDVTFTGFPGTVTLFSPSLPGIPIGANATRSSLKFGRGTNGQISTGTVARVYDAAAGAGPTVRLTNCRAG
jgi:hypothetical protein